MKKNNWNIVLAASFLMNIGFISAQPIQPIENTKNPIINHIIDEANNNSQLEQLAFELVDVIGPRLVGTPGGKKAHEWLVDTYSKWGIKAENQAFGEWRAWQRGITHVDMTHPRIKSLEATQLAWNPNQKKPVEAEVIALPIFNSKEEFKAWLPNAKGKIVLASMYQKYGRPDQQIKEFSLEGDYILIQADRKNRQDAWNTSMRIIEHSINTLPVALEEAGAAGVALSYWTGVTGSNRIFGTRTKKIPVIDIAQEDYGMLHRLASNGLKPKIKIQAESKDLGVDKMFNTIAVLPGTENPEEYVILSAHVDSWDGAPGACDNATGVITMMETARILKKWAPNNKRTIIIGHWGSEEQGLNGSRAFVEDHPEIIQKTKIVFNQDSGTGRVHNLNGQGFIHSYDFLGRWLEEVPKAITNHIETNFPGMPSGGGSDHASFTTVGIPGISLSSNNWGYGGYTWHTNRDTYDKIMFNEVTRNVILTAILTYQAANDDLPILHDKRTMPLNKDKVITPWPEQRKATRKGGM